MTLAAVVGRRHQAGVGEHPRCLLTAAGRSGGRRPGRHPGRAGGHLRRAATAVRVGQCGEDVHPQKVTVELPVVEARRCRARCPRGVMLGRRDPRSRARRQKAAASRGPQRRDPDRAQAGVDQDPGPDGPRVHRPPEPGEVRGPAHRLPGGRLPQHLRVLGGPRGDLPHRRRPVHAALRLLPDRHRQAAAARPRRAAPGRRVRAADGAALRHHHRRRPRRPARRRRVAVRRDGARDPRRSTPAPAWRT